MSERLCARHSTEFRILCGGQCQLSYISPCSGGYSPIGGGALGKNLGSVCRQDSQTLSLEYTFVAKKILLNIQILPKITRPYTVSGVSIPFIRPIQIWTITHPF